jgi:hypothetical protein
MPSEPKTSSTSSLLEDFEAATLGYAVRRQSPTLLRALAEAEQAARLKASGFAPRSFEHEQLMRRARRYGRLSKQLRQWMK